MYFVCVSVGTSIGALEVRCTLFQLVTTIIFIGLLEKQIFRRDSLLEVHYLSVVTLTTLFVTTVQFDGERCFYLCSGCVD